MSTLQENQSLNLEYERNKKEREMKEEIERLKEDIRVFKFTIKTQQEQIQELIAREDKAIEIYEECCKTQIFSTCDLDMYEALKGVDKE